MDRNDQEAVPVLQESRDGDLWWNSESDGWAEETTNVVDTDCQEPGRTFYETVLEFLVPDWSGSEADSLMIQARDMVESNVERGQHL